MKRFAEEKLKRWYGKKQRKPLIIRGARQVGKSTLVRNFAQDNQLNLVEVNLERAPLLDELFKTNETRRILLELESLASQNITDQNTLLFLDEIQATPSAIAALRYLSEDRPRLAIIAAGSLLEFTLASHHFSMPVGRVEYFHLGPMSFKEFLLALEESYLFECLEKYSDTKTIAQTAHDKLLKLQREYFFIGGMPEAVLVYSQTKSLSETREIHRSIIQTYQDDFSKYATAAVVNRLPVSYTHLRAH